MDNWVQLWEKPAARDISMIAGWHQWADAGSISSGLPLYLIEKTEARKIGQIDPRGFYLFQLPGAHHFLRPQIKLQEGYRKELTTKRNDFYYAGDDEKGLVIFVGDEPHLNAEQYADSFLSAVKELGVHTVAAVGGVYGPVPYYREREVSCVYSLPQMKEELGGYAVSLSNYEGGATIGTYLAHRAEADEVRFAALYAFVPAYDFTEISSTLRGMQIETDFKAWYDLMRRLCYLFDLEVDLSELEGKSEELLRAIDANIDGLESRLPRPQVREHLRKLAEDFTEKPFSPLSDVWERGLEDILGDVED